MFWNGIRRILLVIPVHDRPQDLQDLLSSLNNLIMDGLELTVAIVDDGSPQPIQEALEGKYEQLDLHLFRNEETRGPGFCRNHTARSLESDYIWFLDSDTEIIAPGVLQHMVEVMESNTDLAGTGGVMEDCSNGRLIQQPEVLMNFLFLYRAFPSEGYRATIVESLGTCNLLLRREAYELAEGFREWLPRDEDNDLCLSLHQAGYDFYQDAETMVWHKCSTAGRRSGAFMHFSDSKLYLKNLLGTRVLLLARHAPWRLPILPFLDAILAPLIIFRIITGEYSTNRGLIKLNVSRTTWTMLLLSESIRAYIKGLWLFFRRP